MSAELSAQYGDILVSCPMPGQEHLQAERLGDFVQTEVGQRVLGPALGNVKILLDTGMGEDQALTIALGPAIVRDDEGQIRRQSVPVLTTSEAIDSKKK